MEMLGFLGCQRPCTGPWADLPRTICRQIGEYVLEPLVCEFVEWHAMSIVREKRTVLDFGLRLRTALPLYNSGDGGVAICGPGIERCTGALIRVFSSAYMLDGFCRADLGLTLCRELTERCGSGIWWESGDGDVFIAGDAGGVGFGDSKEGGWIGGDLAVETGVLPTWFQDRDTSVPSQAWPVHFGVSWSADTAGRFRLLRLERFSLGGAEAEETRALLHACSRNDVAGAVAAARRHLQSGAVTPEVLAAVAEVAGRDACEAVLSTLCGGPLPLTEALAVPLTRSGRERVALQLAPWTSDIASFELALSKHLPCSPSFRTRLAGRYPRLWRRYRQEMEGRQRRMRRKRQAEAERGVLEVLRIQLFEVLPISTIRVTLWYSPQEDGKMVLDKAAEKYFKQAGYRWFQLANSSDGRRGQVMCQKRNQERDARAPADPADLSLSTCLLVSRQRQMVEEVGPVEAPCNILVLAECLRRHCAATQSMQASKSSSAVELLQKLHRREGAGVGIVRTKASSTPKDWEEFAAECLKDVEAPQSLIAWFGSSAEPSVQSEEEKSSEVAESLCAGLAVSVNWKEQRTDPDDGPDVFRVAVPRRPCSSLMFCHWGPSGSPVVYLATEDDQIDVMLWRLPGQMADADLYAWASRLLKEAPPEALDDARSVVEVVMPRLCSCGVARDSEHRAAAEALEGEESVASLDLAGARELCALKLCRRAPAPGALPSQAPAGQVLNIDGEFLMALWHGKYEDLEVPLFVTRLRPPAP
eukprot:s1127_g2.t1